MKRLMILMAVILTAVTVPAMGQGMTGEVVPQSQSALDSFFTTNAVPGQLQYWEFIDTMFWYIGSTYTNALAAQQAAQTAQSINQRTIGSIYVAVGLSSGAQQTWTYYATNGFSSNTVAVGTLNPHGTLLYYVWLTNYFAAPLPSLAATSFHGPAYFTCAMPAMSGGDLSINLAPGSSPLASGANVSLSPYTTSDSTNTYTLTTNYFAFYVNLGGNSGPNQMTNAFLFTFYQ